MNVRYSEFPEAALVALMMLVWLSTLVAALASALIG